MQLLITIKIKYIRLYSVPLIIGLLWGCAPVQTAKEYNSFSMRQDELRNEVIALNEELDRVTHQGDNIVASIDAQHIQIDDLTLQLQDLRAKERELKQALNRYERNVNAIQPVLQSVDFECRKKIEASHDTILESAKDLLLAFIPSFRIASLLLNIPSIIQKTVSLIGYVNKANKTLEFLKNINNAQQLEC